MSWRTIPKETEKHMLIEELIREAELDGKKVLVIKTIENRDVKFDFECESCTFELDKLAIANFDDLDYYNHLIFYTQWDLNDDEIQKIQYQMYDNMKTKTADFLVSKGRKI